MTFVDGMRAFRLGERRHAGWWADKHLRRGYLVALPIFVVGAAICMRDFADSRSYALFWFVMTPAALLCNVVWFAVAAWSRAKES